MDNAQDANCIEGGGRLFSVSPAKRHITKNSGSSCKGQKITGFSKSKKHQLRKLDAVGKENLSYREGPMGCVGSDGEDALRPGTGSCRGFKTPKMIFDDCNTVYQASVPRKLRSAIRKRSNESISPPLLGSKKIKHVAEGVELLREDGILKSNQNKPQGELCAKDGTLGPITKDEEEVAEALYSLAVMFPDATKTKKKMVDKQAKASSSDLQKTEKSISRFIETEIPKTEVEPKTIRQKDDKSTCSNVLDSAAEFVLPSPNSTTQHDFSVAKQPTGESGCHIPEVNLPLTTFAPENECTTERPIEFVVSNAWAELSLEHRSKLLKPDKNVPSINHPQIAFELNGASCSQPEITCTTKENRDTGSSLCSGLSSRISSDHEGAKHPAWFKSTCSVAQSPISNSVTAKKDAQVVPASKKSWMRCSTHVYISHFIKDFKMTNRRDRLLVLSSQITVNGGLEQAPHDTSNGPSQVKNSLSGSISTKGTGCSIPEKDATEVRNAILLHKRLVQDQQHVSKSDIYNAQKQSLDFLSLPTGSRVETVRSSNKPGHGPEALSPLPFPCLQSQYQSAVPFPTSQNYYSSASFAGYPSAATMQQVHLPAFLGNMPLTAGASSSTSSQPEQQQRAPLLIAHYKPGVALPNVPNWQNGLSDLSPPPAHHTQSLFQPSRSSVETIGSKYAAIIQQQPSLSATTALLPPSTIKGQYHILPSIYEGNVVGGTYPACADNLQSAYFKC
ncbi:hypothetical protein M9H77_24956 [Catharanthus roseus]|uniref:Uncharacterized protein n=1 Tax=Catharanthus roseus TaxID=4058 RepID=A0ACC0A832_CATRO|nr:hypothetical protein M9H77_24956 [Catharanthus roseus]